MPCTPQSLCLLPRDQWDVPMLKSCQSTWEIVCRHLNLGDWPHKATWFESWTGVSGVYHSKGGMGRKPKHPFCCKICMNKRNKKIQHSIFSCGQQTFIVHLCYLWSTHSHNLDVQTGAKYCTFSYATHLQPSTGYRLLWGVTMGYDCTHL